MSSSEISGAAVVLQSASGTAPLSTMASAMLFGTVFFATAALAAASWSNGDLPRTWKAANHPRASPLDVRSYSSVFTLLYQSCILGLIMFYAYLCEYHPPYPHATKSYNRDEFFFMTALLFVVSFFTLKKSDPKEGSAAPAPVAATGGATAAAPASNGSSSSAGVANKEGAAMVNGNAESSISVAPSNDKTEILNRDQTEEWKGWMQFMFLLYHYYHAEEVYNSIRVMITCYVWMTGFGNFSFFYIKGDYGSVRVLQMLWRLNFLVLFLCLTQGTTYILYYICLLHTYYFMMVYVTMRVFKNVNYSKYGIRIKLMAVAILIYVIWDLKNPIFWLLHRPFLGETPMLGATAGAMWEWYFRSSLDHWSTFMGMTFALNFPIVSLFFRRLEAEPFWRHVAAKALTGLAFAAATVWWVVVPFRHGKFDYNQTNAYLAWIPLYSYIYFRNLTPWLRNHTLDLLHQIGKTTLETYLMQHHIWLTSDAKSLLTLIPGWPMMNFLVVSILYVVVSRRLYQLTLFLRGMVLPDHRNTCLRNLAGMAAVLGGYLMLAGLLRLVGALNLITVLCVSVASGLALYRVILSTTWSPLHASEPGFSSSSSNGDVSSTSSAMSSSFVVAKIKSRLSRLAPLVGAAAVVVVGAVWHHAATTGASKILPLPPHCQDRVQDGAWISVDSCNEFNRGDAYRQHDVASLGTCGATDRTLVWGWKSAPSNSLCRFVQRDAGSLLKRLNHRKVTFLGDSTIRHMFHATRRMVGDPGAGAYNTTIEKWTDIPTKKYKGFDVDFVWAPFTDVLISSVKTISEAPNSRPDLVVLGGGAWDRLHRYNNESEQLNLKQEVRDLAAELKKLRSLDVPVVWITPTTVNKWALMTEPKQVHINEENMGKVRSLYREEGVHESVSFVLDGPTFTQDRVAESYDGVHYPLSVYNGGAQILANAFDWLLVGDPLTDPFAAPSPGKMAHPLLGLYVLAVAAIVIFFFDGLLGFSYLAGLVVPAVRPARLYEEAFSTLHAKLGLPFVVSHIFQRESTFDDDELEKSNTSRKPFKSKDSERGDDSDGNEDDANELNALLRQVSEGDEAMIRTV